MNQVSIIVCTYNPVEIIFSRVLEALLHLRNPDSIIREIIIVDNNSSEPIETKEYISRFLSASKIDAKVVSEKKPGLTNARIKGVRSSVTDIILFVDDDNILEPDYAVVLHKLFNAYPNVACWGPGSVNVEFSGQVPEWVLNYKGAFQQKTKKSAEYGCVKGWHSFSPAGTGLAVRRMVLEKYIDFVDSNRLNALDRTGKSLNSGGDSQIIHTATILGYASGQHPELKLIHYIDQTKANLEYLKNLLFQVNRSIYVHVEVFNELKTQLVRIPPRLELISFIMSITFRSGFNLRSPEFVLPLAGELGLIFGSYQILGIPVPRKFRFLHWLIKLKK